MCVVCDEFKSVENFCMWAKVDRHPDFLGVDVFLLSLLWNKERFCWSGVSSGSSCSLSLVAFPYIVLLV